MAKTRLQVRTAALQYARDPAFDATSANLYLDAMYAQYGRAILRDRIRRIGAGTFVTIPMNDYIADSVDSNAVEIVTLESEPGVTLGQNADPLEQEPFYAVVADAQRAVAAPNQRRFGVMKLKDSKKWRVAVFPACSVLTTLVAWGYAEVTALTADGDVLDCEDPDADNVARLTAAEIMADNGEDETAIARVLRPIDRSIMEKLGYVIRRVPQAHGESGKGQA